MIINAGNGLNWWRYFGLRENLCWKETFWTFHAFDPTEKLNMAEGFLFIFLVDSLQEEEKNISNHDVSDEWLWTSNPSPSSSTSSLSESPPLAHETWVLQNMHCFGSSLKVRTRLKMFTTSVIRWIWFAVKNLVGGEICCIALVCDEMMGCGRCRLRLATIQALVWSFGCGLRLQTLQSRAKEKVWPRREWKMKQNSFH